MYRKEQHALVSRYILNTTLPLAFDKIKMSVRQVFQNLAVVIEAKFEDGSTVNYALVYVYLSDHPYKLLTDTAKDKYGKKIYPPVAQGGSGAAYSNSGVYTVGRTSRGGSVRCRKYTINVSGSGGSAFATGMACWYELG